MDVKSRWSTADMQVQIETFGLRLRAARERAGLSQAALERLSGVDQSMISRIERGLLPRVSLIHLIRLSVALLGQWPFGVCPHDHRCVYRPLIIEGPRDKPYLDKSRWLFS